MQDRKKFDFLILNINNHSIKNFTVEQLKTI